MQSITSKENETIKNVKKLKEKKYREQEGKFIVEGIKMIEEAIQEQAQIDKIIICEDCVLNYQNEEEQKEDSSSSLGSSSGSGLGSSLVISQELRYEIAKQNCIRVPEKIFETLTSVENPQGMLAIIEKRKDKNISYKEDLIVILDGIQDPGNLGTILRTIDSTDLTQVILTKDTADVYNPKVVRASMGAIYRINVNKINTYKEIEEFIKEARKNDYKIVATALSEESKSIYDLDLKKTILIIGNEAKGVSKEMLELADTKAILPMLGKTESLNVAVATGIILYEYIRRKEH